MDLPNAQLNHPWVSQNLLTAVRHRKLLQFNTWVLGQNQSKHSFFTIKSYKNCYRYSNIPHIHDDPLRLVCDRSHIGCARMVHFRNGRVQQLAITAAATAVGVVPPAEVADFSKSSQKHSKTKAREHQSSNFVDAFLTCQCLSGIFVPCFICNCRML